MTETSWKWFEPHPFERPAIGHDGPCEVCHLAKESRLHGIEVDQVTNPGDSQGLGDSNLSTQDAATANASPTSGHILVVEIDEDDPEEVRGTVICLGVTDRCVTWWECIKEHVSLEVVAALLSGLENSDSELVQAGTKPNDYSVGYDDGKAEAEAQLAKVRELCDQRTAVNTGFVTLRELRAVVGTTKSVPE